MHSFSLDEISTFFCDLYKFARNKNNIKYGFDKLGNKYPMYHSEYYLESSTKGKKYIADKLLSIPRENQLPYAKLVISSICDYLGPAESDFCISEERDFYRPGKKQVEDDDYIMIETKNGNILCTSNVKDCALYTLKGWGEIECSQIKEEIFEFIYGIDEIFTMFNINIYDEAKKMGFIVLDKYDLRHEGYESYENKMKKESITLSFDKIIDNQYISHIQELKDIMKTQGIIDDDYKWKRNNGYPVNTLGKIHRYLRDKGVILSTPPIAATVVSFCLEFGIELESKKSTDNSICRRSMECSYTNDDQLRFENMFNNFINKYKK